MSFFTMSLQLENVSKNINNWPQVLYYKEKQRYIHKKTSTAVGPIYQKTNVMRMRKRHSSYILKRRCISENRKS